MPLHSAYLYYNVTEKVRHMMESYFRLEVPLHFSYSHLVCRTAIDGERGPEERVLSNLISNSWSGLVLDLSLETSLLLPNPLLFLGGCRKLDPEPSLGR